MATISPRVSTSTRHFIRKLLPDQSPKMHIINVFAYCYKRPVPVQTTTPRSHTGGVLTTHAIWSDTRQQPAAARSEINMTPTRWHAVNNVFVPLFDNLKKIRV